MTSKFFRILILLITLGSAVTYAQQRVTGTVSDDSGVLSGVVVILKDAPVTTGVTTDINGTYSIEVPDENAVLEFQCLGYKDCSETVGRRSVINVSMEEENVMLDEVVFEIDGVCADAPVHSVLGSFYEVYESADKGSFNIWNGEELLTQVSVLAGVQ